MSDDLNSLKLDWTDPDNHEAHRRMAAERVGNFIGCAENCQTASSMYPEILELRVEVERLTRVIAEAVEWANDSVLTRSDEADYGYSAAQSEFRAILQGES